MKVYVKLYALLRQHHPGPDRSQPLEVELPPGATLADLGSALRLPPKLLKVGFVNDDTRALDTVLQDGDRVGLFPPVAGGQQDFVTQPVSRAKTSTSIHGNRLRNR